MMIKVFGMQNCSGCDTVKTLLKTKGVEFVELDVMNPDHMAEAQTYGVRGVPTVVINNDGTEHVFTGSTKPVLDSIILHAGL
jgi:glutaredoxin